MGLLRGAPLKGNTQHDTTTTVLLYGDGVVKEIRSVAFLPNVKLCDKARNFNFGLIRLENLEFKISFGKLQIGLATLP